MTTTSGRDWRRCSSCKQPIVLGADYWVCNVSTCNRKGTDFVFCTVSCWDAHVPIMNHRESWAEERVAPATHDAPAPSPPRAPEPRPKAESRAPERRIAREATATAPAPSEDIPREILIVASKLKSYVRAKSGMNTSDRVMDALSDKVRQLCDQAIRRAREAERKTLLDRDF